MEPRPREASAAGPPRPRFVLDRPALPNVHSVAVVFKERRYHDGGHKTWLFSNIYHVEVVQGRLHLTRAGHGLVFDVPYEEVEQVYVDDQQTLGPRPEPEGEE